MKVGMTISANMNAYIRFTMSAVMSTCYELDFLSMLQSNISVFHTTVHLIKVSFQIIKMTSETLFKAVTNRLLLYANRYPQFTVY